MRAPGKDGMSTSERPTRAAGAAALVLAIAALIVVGFSARIAVTTHSALPFWDEWVTASDVRTAMTRGFGQVQWLARHGEHTIALTRAIAVADGYMVAATNTVALTAVWVLM